MPKSRVQKRVMLEKLKQNINKAQSIIFASFKGLTVKENEELRKELKKEFNEYLVSKKTLLNIALREITEIDMKKFEGQIAVIFGFADAVSPAKIIDRFKKDKEGKIEFVGGILENRFIDASKVQALATIPSRQELYAKLVSSLNSPVVGLVNVLSGNLRNFIGVLNNIKDKKI